MEAVGQLTGGVAHDFNNLLTIVLGNLEALEAALVQRDLAALAREHITPAVQAARRGVELVRRLLTFSRQQPMARSAVEVGERIRSIAELLRRTLGETIALELQLPKEPLYAHTDGHQLENALLNLALNARDAMVPAGGRLTIRALPCKILSELAERYGLTPGPYVQFDVIDTGCGMPPEVLAHAFEPFFTTKPFGRGSGLGLAMVYGFVRQSGGAIRLRSEPDKGTTVTFVLPRLSAPSAEGAPSASPVEEGAAEPLTLLLVEDEPEVRHLLRQQLMRLGHRVLEAENGAEALELIEHVAEIDAVVTDAVMPGGCDGVTLIARAHTLRPGLPAVLVSGYWQERPLPPDVPFLAKPVSQAELAAVLRSVSIAAKQRAREPDDADRDADRRGRTGGGAPHRAGACTVWVCHPCGGERGGGVGALWYGGA